MKPRISQEWRLSLVLITIAAILLVLVLFEVGKRFP